MEPGETGAGRRGSRDRTLLLSTLKSPFWMVGMGILVLYAAILAFR